MIQQVSSGAQELIFLISSPGMLLLLIPMRPVGSDFPFADLVLRVARSGKRIAGGEAGMQSTAHTRLGQFRAFPLEWQVGASISLGGHGGKDPPHSRGSTKVFFLQNQKQ